MRKLMELQGFRNAHREYLLLTDNDLANLPLDWLPEKWERAVFPHGRDSRMLHRRFFELGVFSQIMRELNSGDLNRRPIEPSAVPPTETAPFVSVHRTRISAE
nr:hypothetical protein [Trinickia symbiotica]